ncbi:hypothetical protein CTAM01_07065 [Colletotrichum tamarilloi]|uniref:Zn(2)-C6 fungal-type domain-containing protein n=1 Tax=Colletotrichum tamarilloi TaxID=1209934 RepID=A0ABQ9R9X0_9PEZI|nr:uncharacterized protein CTAM01_07065 [Colletotrichum tamarilloi]KAK1499144.1 hypothetical protein CTAM01_07065 [Colletotrichum tamarilloi]
MTPPAPADSPFNPTITAPATEDCGEPPAKRRKAQACSRCRRRKQKRDDQRPCANCARSGERCNEAVLPSSYQTRPPDPGSLRSRLGDIALLEERISRLEETDARLQVVVNNRNNHVQHSYAQEPLLPSSLSRAHEASHTHHHADKYYHHRRRVSFASGPGIGPEASLSRSSPAIGLLATFARSEEDNPPPQTLSNPSVHDGGNTARRHDQEIPLDTATETSLFDETKVHCRYPFLRLDDFRNPASRPREAWASYLTNMIFSIGLLLEKTFPSSCPSGKPFPS